MRTSRAHDQFEVARAQRSRSRIPWIVHSASEEKIPLGLDCFSGGGRARNDGEDCSFARQVELAGFLTHRVPPWGGTRCVRVPCSGRACGSRTAARACEPCTPRLDPARKQPFHPWSRSTVGSAALGSERVRRPGARQRSGAGTFRGGVPGVAPPWPSDRERGAQGGGSAGLTVYRSGAMRERSWTNLWVSRRRVSSSGARRSELGWTVAIT